MRMQSRWHRGILLGIVIGLLNGPATVFSADAPTPKAQPSKPKAESRAAKPKPSKPKGQPAESAAPSKACFGTAPTIEKVSPDEGKTGDTVTITGTNFGTAECLRGVSFGPGHPAKFTLQSATKISATVPTGGRKGLVILTVTTASGEDSKSFLVK